MDSQELHDNNSNVNKGSRRVLLRIIFNRINRRFHGRTINYRSNFLAHTVQDSLQQSSKVCELGLLNYKAKHVFYRFENSKYRCRYDYYWASVFKVEYRDHSLDQMQLALTEAPNEALPVSCRPNFGAAWLTKDKFKVNETYDCWYTSGIPTVKLYSDGFFSCQAEDPSLIEMMKRYFIISTKVLRAWFSSKGYLRLETLAGIVAGFSTSIITISFVTILRHMKSWLPQAINTFHIKRLCFLLVYFSVTGWLASQYWRRLSIPFIKAFNY